MLKHRTTVWAGRAKYPTAAPIAKVMDLIEVEGASGREWIELRCLDVIKADGSASGEFIAYVHIPQITGVISMDDAPVRVTVSAQGFPSASVPSPNQRAPSVRSLAGPGTAANY